MSRNPEDIENKEQPPNLGEDRVTVHINTTPRRRRPGVVTPNKDSPEAKSPPLTRTELPVRTVFSPDTTRRGISPPKGREVSSPRSRGISPVRRISASREISLNRGRISSPNRGVSAPRGRETSPNRQTSAPRGREMSVTRERETPPNREISTTTSRETYPGRGTSLFRERASSPNREERGRASSPDRETPSRGRAASVTRGRASSPDRETPIRGRAASVARERRETFASRGRETSPNRETSSRGREASVTRGRVLSPNREPISRGREASRGRVLSPNREPVTRGLPPSRGREASRGREVPKREEKSVILKDYQIPHVAKLVQTLNEFGFAIDISRPGKGKTYAAGATAVELKVPNVIYIAPKRIITQNMNKLKLFGISEKGPIKAVPVGYESLRSARTRNPRLIGTWRKLNNKIVERKDYVVTKQDKKGKITKQNASDYRVSQYFMDLVEAGCLIILDEVSKIKNNTTLSFDASIEVERYVLDNFPRTGSRILELSALPGTKPEQIISILTRLGVIRSTPLYETKNGERLIGAQDLVDFCYKIDPEQTNQIVGELWANSFSGNFGELVQKMCENLYMTVFKGVITHAMTAGGDDIPEDVTLDIKDGFYKPPEEDMEIIDDTMSNLNSELAKMKKDPRGKPILDFSVITPLMIDLETSKINLFIRLAKDVLDSDPNAKVCIALNYKFSVQCVAKALAEYGVIRFWATDLYDKAVSMDKREEMREDFNATNLDYRVLVGLSVLLYEGIDLDDRDGRFPRTAFASPSFSYERAFQFGGRFYRADTKSSAVVRFVYALSRTGIEETKIINIIARQQPIARGTIGHALVEGAKLPGEYEREEEDLEDDVGDGYYIISELFEDLVELNRRKEEMASGRKKETTGG
jgi:hypothetical protein